MWGSEMCEVWDGEGGNHYLAQQACNYRPSDEQNSVRVRNGLVEITHHGQRLTFPTDFGMRVVRELIRQHRAERQEQRERDAIILAAMCGS